MMLLDVLKLIVVIRVQVVFAVVLIAQYNLYLP